MDDLSPEYRNVALVELLDRVLEKGVVLSGDITISVADVDLIYLGLRVLLRTPLESTSTTRALSDTTDGEGSDDLVLRVRDPSGADQFPE